MTTIRDPKGEKPDKSFTFDHSYWSHDGFEEGEDKVLRKTGDRYHSQQDVYEDLGGAVLNNAYNGFNSTLFAYGQTGSGKSYSMVGYGPNKGIVPLAFEKLFERINANEDDKIKYQVTYSMLEIYMEAVDDLLIKSGKGKKKGGLKIRQNPKLGSFYVEGLSKIPVSSYEEISNLMDQGTANRTVAATQMNATSSRAHTLITLQVDQIMTGEDGKKTTRQSTVNLVDLAGSERASGTGATGDRLKEGAQINKSLSALGNVISALASGKKAPFRDSVLTKLLQNALGGNSKTIMIAALSPAGINYDETLSTLRYADRAKQIKNKATVNESATDKLIREMKEENEKLKKMLEGGMIMSGTDGMSNEDVTKMKKKMESEIRAQLKESEANAARMDESEYEKKLAEMQSKFESENAAKGAKEQKMMTSPHMKNINEDSALSGMVVHFFEPGANIIGRKGGKGEVQPNITLSGLSIADNHATIEVPEDDAVPKLIQKSPALADKMLLNGQPFSGEIALTHHDRLLFGTNHLYVYIDPKATKIVEEGRIVGWASCGPDGDNTLGELPVEIDWEMAQSEILEFKQKNQDASLPQAVQDDLRELAPMIDEANAIAHELERHRLFEFVSLTGPIVGMPVGEARAMIKMINVDTDNEWMLNRVDFEGRRDRMQEIYRKHKLDEEHDGDDSDCEDDDEEEEEEEEEEEDGDSGVDPFYHEPGTVVVGTTDIPLDCLAYNLDFDDDQFIQDYTGRNQGTLAASIIPCNAEGEVDSDLRENPDDALGKPLHFKLAIKSAQFKNPKWSKQTVSYQHEYVGPDVVTTEEGKEDEEGNVVWTHHPSHSCIVAIAKVDDATMQWITESTLTLVIRSWQSDDPAMLTRTKTTIPALGIMTIVTQFRDGKRGPNNTIDAIECLLKGQPAAEPALDEAATAPAPDAPKDSKQDMKLEAQEKEFTELQAKFKGLSGDLEEAQTLRQASVKIAEKLEGELSNANAKLEKMQADNDAALGLATAEGAGSDELQVALAKATASVKRLEGELEEATASLKNAESEVRKLKAEKTPKSKACTIM